MDPNHLPSLKQTNSSLLKIGFPKRKSNWVSTTHIFSGSKIYMSFTFGAGWFHSNMFWNVHPGPFGFPMIQFDEFPHIFSTQVGGFNPPTRLRGPIGRFSRRPLGPLGMFPSHQKQVAKALGGEIFTFGWWSWCTYGWGANEIKSCRVGLLFVFFCKKTKKRVCMC